MNLVGEMIIGKSMLQRAIAEFERRHSKDPLRGKTRGRAGVSVARAGRAAEIGDEDPHGSRRAALPPLSAHRPRRRQAAQQGHRARSSPAQNTDLDKSILDALAEPLAHLVRNAADHGIETAAEREAAGKSPRGTIRLNAYHDGRSGRHRSLRRRPRPRPRKDRPPRHRARTTSGRGSRSAQRDRESPIDFRSGPQHRGRSHRDFRPRRRPRRRQIVARSLEGHG